MVALSPPESPRRRARSREVDSLSLDGEDINSIKMALNSMFEAAVALDTFLAGEGVVEPGGEQVANDDSSFASEERRLRDSEAELRRALDSIENPDGDDMSDNISDDVQNCESLDAFSAESYESPETQVPLLQSVSPFGSPFSESSLTPSKIDTNSPVLEAPTLLIHSPNDSPRKRQVRPYGLRKRAEESSFVDLEASLEKVGSPRGNGSAQLMANALFGRTEYAVRPLFSRSQEYKRTVQGTISVLLASGIVVADHVQSLPLIWALLVPILVAVVQAKLPHQTDETMIAIVILGTHIAMSHVSTLHVV